MDLFDIYPKISSNGIPIVDISRGYVVVNDIKPYLIEYEMSVDQSVNDIAWKLYGDDVYYWLIYLVNPGYIFNQYKNNYQYDLFVKEKSVSCLQFSQSFTGLKYTQSKVKIAAYDVSGKEIKITNIDSSRNQITLAEKLVYPPTVYYVNADTDAVVDSGDLFFVKEYIDPAYFENINEYVVDTGGGLEVGQFEIVDFLDTIAYYKFNDILYEKYPDLGNDYSVEQITWGQYLEEENLKKRVIKVVDPKYINDVIVYFDDFSKRMQGVL